MNTVKPYQKPVHNSLGMIGGLFIAAVTAFFFGFILMLLWNWLMPVIFGLPTITFWQGWGLVLLTHILFKAGPHDHGHHDHGSVEFSRKFRERMKTHLSHDVDEKPENVV